MAHYKTFWDLASSQAYTTHTVERFDTGSTTGGGTFKWIQSNNTSIVNIPGIRIKPTATILGYWERTNLDGPWSVDWFGCNNTAGQGTIAEGSGVTVGVLNTRYNSWAAGLPNTINSTDTYDTAALKTAMNIMGVGLVFAINMSKPFYHINSAILLPRKFYSTSVKEYDIYEIDGKGAQIEIHSSAFATPFNMFDRTIASLVDANSQVGTTFVIKNICFLGKNNVQTGLMLKATYNSQIENCTFKNLATGCHLRFCLGAKVNSCMAINITDIALNVDTGSSAVYANGAFGGSYTSADSQSNSTEVFKFRYFSANAGSIGIAVNGCSVVLIDQPILEGNPGTGMSSGVYFHIRDSANVKDFTVNRAHLETNYADAAIRLFVGAAVKPIIKGIYAQYAGTLVGLSDGAVVSSKVSMITIKDVEFAPNSTRFQTITTGGNNHQWSFESCYIDPLLTNSWVGGVVPGSANVVVKATDSNTKVYDYLPRFTR